MTGATGSERVDSMTTRHPGDTFFARVCIKVTALQSEVPHGKIAIQKFERVVFEILSEQ